MTVAVSLTTDAVVDRRRADRTLLLYRSATIASGSRQGLAIVRNISTGGLMARTSIALSVGDEVTIELASRLPLRGVVRWTRGGFFGMSFAASISLSDVLSKFSDHKSSRRRMPRLLVSVPARVFDDGVGHQVTILDISVTGVRFQCDHRFGFELVTLDHPDLGRRLVRIIWNKDRLHGGVFSECLDWDLLNRWADANTRADRTNRIGRPRDRPTTYVE